jgi:hypothetical protein
MNPYCKRCFSSVKEILQSRYPNLLPRVCLVKSVIKHLLAGNQVIVNVDLFNGDSHYDYIFDITVRQSKRSPNKWTYIPRHMPKGDYSVAVRRK